LTFNILAIVRRSVAAGRLGSVLREDEEGAGALEFRTAMPDAPAIIGLMQSHLRGAFGRPVAGGLSDA
jgi:hypothetical protein